MSVPYATRFLAVMANGRPIVQARVRFKRYLEEHFGDGEEVDLIITRHAKSSTDGVRAFYRGVIVPIFADWMGEANHELVHEALAWKFLRVEDCPKTGLPRRKSTSREGLTHEEWTDYLMRLQAWGTVDCGLLFPEPEKDPRKRELRRVS